MTDKESKPIFEPADMPQFKSALEAARLYLMRWGFSSIAVEPRSKKPLFKDWGNTEVTEQTLPKLFYDDSLNIGIILGPKSGGVVDVDLDCPESRALAPYLLPKTGLIRGRMSAPGSGYLYVVTDANVKYIETRDPILPKNERNVLVELRTSSEGRAHMTVVPPSVHPSGEHYVWDKFGDPAHISGEELTRVVYQLAAGSLIVRYSQRGSRQDLILPLAGILYRLNYELDFSIHFVRSIAIVVGDEQVEMCADAVRSTYENAEHGQNITGAPTLAEVLGDKKLADRIVRYLKLGSEKAQGKRLTSVQRLLDFQSGLEIFRDQKDKTFVSFWMDDHRETWSIDSDRFEGYMRHIYLEKYDTILDSRAAADVKSFLEAKAFGAPTREVYTRVAGLDGEIFINLANPAWEVVRVSANEWEIEADPLVYFRRNRGLLPLPYPDREGSINLLRPYLNVESDKEWVLLVAWMVQALNPEGPYPLLSLVGAQGSAKSTRARVLKRVIDPDAAELRFLTRNFEDLMLTANNAWCLAFDNVTEIWDTVSAALCVISTGGALVRRKKYTNEDETFLTAKRPCILTSIAEVVTQNDLLDRTILINVPMILKENRRYEKEFWEEFEQVRGRIFGGLLNLLCETLRILPEVELKEAPRMADFARLGVAVERALGLAPGLFLQAYEETRMHSIVQSLESSPVAGAIIRLMSAEAEWSGRAGELLAKLNELTQFVDKSEDWPKKPRGMTNALNDLEPDLLRAGIKIERRGAPRGGGTIITLRRVERDVEIHNADGPETDALFR
jgi:hypothetical protein